MNYTSLEVAGASDLTVGISLLVLPVKVLLLADSATESTEVPFHLGYGQTLEVLYPYL